MKDYELSYKCAQEDLNPSFRQEFINIIDLGNYKKFFSKIIYKDKGKKIMTCKPSWKTNIFLKLHESSKIIVYPPAFDNKLHQNFHDFYCSLIYHEGFHAKEYYHNHNNVLMQPSIIDNNSLDCYLFSAKMELRAWQNQLENISNKNSLQYKILVFDNIRVYENLVKKMESKIAQFK